MRLKHGRPDRTENPDRSGFWYVVRIFGPRLVGPVRGPDFRSGFLSVRYVVRSLVRTRTWSGPWYGFWSEKIRTGADFFSVRSVVRTKIPKNWKNKGVIPNFQNNEKYPHGPDRTKNHRILARSGFLKKCKIPIFIRMTSLECKKSWLGELFLKVN